MRRSPFAVAALVGFAIASASAASAATYDWKLAGADSGAGTFTTGAADNGGYDLLSFTGEIDGQTVSLLGGQPGWEPRAGPPAGPAFSPFGLSYDNIVYPMFNSPIIPCAPFPGGGFAGQAADAYGILFNYGTSEGEIWGQAGATPGSAYTFEIASGVDDSGAAIISHYDGAVVFSVPEPATWTMMLVGFGLLGASARRRRTLSA